MSNTFEYSSIIEVYNSPTECFMLTCGMRDNETSNPHKCYNFHCLRRCTKRYVDEIHPTMFNTLSTKG